MDNETENQISRLYYSPSTNGFYSDDMHGDIKPQDCIEIAQSHHNALMRAQYHGLRIIPGPDGMPIATEQAKRTPEQMETAIKAERDRRMHETGYQIDGHRFHSDEKSRNDHLRLALMGESMPAGLKWKTMDGDYVDMNPELARRLLAAAVELDNQLFMAAEKHIAAMQAAQEPGDYDYSAGWPDGYNQ